MKKVLAMPIKYGDSGKKVEDVQKMLQKVGSSIKVNGEFGIGMSSAVKAFQKKNKLPVTGIVDLNTMEKLTVLSASKKAAKKTGGAKK